VRKRIQSAKQDRRLKEIKPLLEDSQLTDADDYGQEFNSFASQTTFVIEEGRLNHMIQLGYRRDYIIRCLT